MTLEPSEDHQEREIQQTELLKFSGTSHTCCVSIIDIVNSTRTASTISETKLGMFYSIFLNYVSDLVQSHHGIVVKNIGDSLLYYFEDSSSSDDAILSSFNCNLDVVKKRNDLNQHLDDEGLPSISYRVSSDYGKVFLASSLFSSTPDIFGPTVNMCAKINHVGKPNTFFIGSDLYINAKNLKGFEFDEITSNELVILKNQYPVYDVKKV
jgi:class 3 adenylate cyclase